METWQPIESAPKDGTRILLFRPTAFCTSHVVIGVWNTDSLHEHPKPYWSHDAEHELGTKEARKFQPSHWMPLPVEPDDPGEARKEAAPHSDAPLLANVENHRFHHR